MTRALPGSSPRSSAAEEMIMRRLISITLAGAALAAPAAVRPATAQEAGVSAAQDLAAVIAAAGPDAPVRVHYSARPGVCGNGDNVWIVDDAGRRSLVRGGNNYSDVRNSEFCETGPVRVELERLRGRITAVRLRVGNKGDAAAGTSVHVTPWSAARYLLAASTVGSADGRAPNELVFAGILADTETWPQLLELARARDLPSRARSTALFWLGQAAGDRVVAGLTSVISDHSDEIAVRESAVFALSRMPGEASTDALISIARTHSEPKIRRSAMFWLARSASPRAIAFFEEVLRAGG
jgi:hypothetical protein